MHSRRLIQPVHGDRPLSTIFLRPESVLSDCSVASLNVRPEPGSRPPLGGDW